jgi:hypothetical protein
MKPGGGRSEGVDANLNLKYEINQKKVGCPQISSENRKSSNLLTLLIG